MEFEEDLNDPTEKAMTVRERPKQERPRSAENSRQAASRRFGRGRRYHSFRGHAEKSQHSFSGEGRNQDSSRASSSSFEEGFENAVSSSNSVPNRGRQRGNYRVRGRSRRYSHSGFSQRSETVPSSGSDYQGGIDPRELVEVLSECSGFSSSLLQLMEKNNMNPSSVRGVVASFGHIFELHEETVVLCPKISLCKDHSGFQGCQNQPSCNDLHVCPQYLTSWCQDKNCVLGHRWFTDHNNHVLNSFYIREVPGQHLRKLLQSVIVKGNGTGQLDVCKDYNGMGCNKQDCFDLHICHSFVVGRTNCTHSGCQLNHNILAKECCQLLINNGISTNEAPRDVILALLKANPTLNNSPQAQNVNVKKESRQQSDAAAANAQQGKDGNYAPGARSRSGKDGNRSNDNEESDQKSIKLPKNQVSETKSVSVKSKSEQRTVWSHDYHGDIMVAEICYYSVETRCRNETNGCQRIHSTLHFHWQVSEHGTNWFNLSRPLVEALEYSFCSVDNDDVTLPRLDPSKLESSLKGLFALMGRDKWKANFAAMILHNSDCSKIMYLRRLCTETINGKDIPPNTYQWYFLDKNSKWVEYGNVDTAGETNLVSSVTSKDIEKHYRQNPGTPLNFRNASYNYKIDFVVMKQTNLNTNVSREVRRRPQQHLKPKGGRPIRQDSAATDIPATWDPMQSQERFRLVELSPTSQEFQNVNRLCGGINVVKIERIQNPYLYKAFQNKVKEMTAVYGSIQKVDVRQLFHGTKPDVVSNICAENFDWRLHGTSSGQSYGRGTYFSPNSGTSLGYCAVDRRGLRYLFIARVAVGSITSGNSSMARPPINPSTGFPYDSTGDGHTVVVKYDKQEYYPEYIITLK
ncbi:protein mono-ADP-ribosyltransferase PARP12-like isoform X2 [Macrobrachium nipponense]